jgi:leader peptidase (prepilin peptidase)/N-methyltransferase
MPLALPFAAVLGLAIGSFLNVVVWRVPRGESLSHPGSHCPSCSAAVRPYDNVPVVSWLVLRGRCRACDERISSRYPLVEALTAVLWVGVIARWWDEPARAALGVVLVTVLVAVTFIDLDHRKIPNVITGPAAVLAVVLGLALDPSFVPEQLIAGLAAALFFFIPAALRPGGMGMGDVKLAGVMGLYLGRAVAPAVLAGLVLGVLVGGLIMARVGVSAGRRTKVPFGPFLAIGGVVALFVGDGLVNAYLDTF